MRDSILKTMLMLPLLAALAYPAWCSSFDPSESFGYSSDEFFGGGSYLGVDTRDITADRLGPLQLKEERGVEVTMVDQDAPAGKAGLKEHDVILSINGEQIESVEQLRRVVHEIPPGRTITIGVSRNGQPVTLKAQLAGRKGLAADAKGFNFVMPAVPAVPPMPPMPDIEMPLSIVVVHSSTRSGLMVENLTPQLGDFFGAKDGHGILVRSVEKGSRAEKAGFRAGDVIIRINGQPISDAGDFGHVLYDRKDNNVNVTIVRDKREQTLTLTLPERKQSDVLEESFGLPEIGTETHIDLSELRSQLAQVRPQMELAVRQIERMKPDIEKATREACQSQGQLKNQIQQMQREIQGQRDQLRKRLRELFNRQADI